MTTYTTTITGDDGSTLTITAAHTPAPAPPKMLLGVDCTDGDLDTVNAQFPRNAYHRIFPGPLGRLPDLTNRNGKLHRLPAHTVRHVSFDRYDPAALGQWLAKLVDPDLGLPGWKIWLSLGHEVDRPDKNTDPTAYRRDLAAVVAACAGHPVVQRVSVILTGYYLDEKKGDPGPYLVDGAELDADRYNMRDALYRSPQALFDPLIDAVLFAGRDNTAIPEFGGERIASDANGQVRAQWLRDCYRHLRANADVVRAVGWWNIGGCELQAGVHVPELATMQTLIDGQ